MKKLITSIALLAAVNTFGQNDPYIGIIPAPVSVHKTSDIFKWDVATAIDNKTNDTALAGLLKSAVKGFGASSKNSGRIILTNKTTTQLPEEGYELRITSTEVIVAGTNTGIFYGIQTLFRMAQGAATYDAAFSLPGCDITDYPRFAYRGLHLDVARHFFPVPVVKQYLDLMASYKLNRFHWHLTDDQGWRIEIKKYPKLTQIGSRRAESKVGNFAKEYDGMYDNTPYGGFYTREEIKEVVAYAAQKHITVIPEIEMPGHALAALSAYPELSCDANKTYHAATTWGVFEDVYCPSETTFHFLEDVLTEVMELFPGKYIHIGGDECPKDAWKKSAFCQQLIKDKKLKDENGLQSYFVARIEKFVNSKGHSIIGWDEILDGGVAPNATIMSWRGEEGGIAAAKQQHNVIMTPGSGGLYFDHAQSKSKQEPLCIGGYAPLSKTYAYDPVPAALNADQRKYIMGVQANLWSEYVTTPDKVFFMVLPRMLALSETAWSPAANKDFTDFSENRLPWQLAQLDAKGYNYRVPEAYGAPGDTILKGGEFTFKMESPVHGAVIHYTIDGYDPKETDLAYTRPVKVTVPKGQKRTFKTIVITPSGHRSNITTAVLSNE
ncbi:beta-N-acetylhexosaminidase [Chitinophagaceae bacterium MMS25-I14]